MTTSFTPERSDAIRDELIEHVAATRVRPRRRLLWPVALVVAGALGGAGISTAAFAASGGLGAAAIAQPAGQPTPAGSPVTAPPGTTPGAPIVSLLGEPRIIRISEARTVSLTERPATSTHVRVTITALSPGDLAFGTDAGGNNARGSFDASDVDSETATTWIDLPLDATTDVLYLTPEHGFTASATLQYLNEVPTRLGLNARGETYGVEGGPDGVPDLVRVVGTAPDGSQVEGYARSADLNATSPDHPGLPSSPDEALAWQDEREQKYPHGWDIPVFDVDGVTQLGTFRIGW